MRRLLAALCLPLMLAGLAAADAAAKAKPKNYERPVGGVLPKGSSFTASSIVACTRERGAKPAQCDLGVVREKPGKGFMMVFWPDGGNRVLYYEKGQIVRYDEAQSDGGAKLTVKREGDMQYVTIGDMHFEIFDAIMTGG
jgi:hypothetical protein